MDNPDYANYVNNRIKTDKSMKLNLIESNAHFFYKLMCATVHNILKTGISDVLLISNLVVGLTHQITGSPESLRALDYLGFFKQLQIALQLGLFHQAPPKRIRLSGFNRGLKKYDVNNDGYLQLLKTIGKLSKLNFRKTPFGDRVFSSVALNMFVTSSYTTRLEINKTLSSIGIPKESVSIKNAGFAVSMPDGYCSDLAIRAYWETLKGIPIEWDSKDKVRTKDLETHLLDCSNQKIPVNDTKILSIHNDT